MFYPKRDSYPVKVSKPYSKGGRSGENQKEGEGGSKVDLRLRDFRSDGWKDALLLISARVRG